AEIDEEEETDEGVRVTFHFENLDYVAQWLVRWRTGAYVEEPEALQELVRQEARATAALYE
ncbi:MAG: WYL domain-containing protein, partial [Rhodothermales bacterium]